MLLAPIPIAVLEFVQEVVPPEGEVVKLVIARIALSQTIIFAGTVTVGVGFTVII